MQTHRGTVGFERAPTADVRQPAMSEGETLMGALVDAINRRDTPGSLRLLTADVRIQDHPEMPDWRLHDGHDAALEWTRTLTGSFRDLRLETRDYQQRSDRFFCEWRVIGRGLRSGILTELVGYATGTLRDGRLSRLELYGDRDEALASFGRDDGTSASEDSRASA